MMPPDELATLSPSHQESAAANPALRFIILLGLLDAFGPLGIDMYLPAFPQIERDLNAPSGAMQLTLSLFLAGLAIGQLICGPISDRVGRRLPLLYGSAAFAVASLTCAFARSIEALILARFVMGLAGSTGMVIARAVVRDSFEEADSSRIYSMLMLVIGIAPIISPSVGGWLMQIGRLGIDLLGAGRLRVPLRHRRRRRPAGDPPARAPQSRFRRHHLRPLCPADRRPPVHGLCGTGQPGARADLRVCRLSPVGFHAVLQALAARRSRLIFASNAVGLIGAAQVNRWLTRHFRYPCHPPRGLARQRADRASPSGPRLDRRRRVPGVPRRHLPVSHDGRADPAQRDRRGDGPVSRTGRCRIRPARNASVLGRGGHGSPGRHLSRRDAATHGLHHGRMCRPVIDDYPDERASPGTGWELVHHLTPRRRVGAPGLPIRRVQQIVRSGIL